MSKPLRLATRRSRLALWQAEHVAARIRALPDRPQVELVPLSTKGDEILDRSLAKIGGKGLFIKELEVAMLAGEADFAVHSMKDVPASLPDNFTLAAILERADPYDALVSVTPTHFESLAESAVVGTSSLRRASQLVHRRPDLRIKPLRGNVDTRIAKLLAGEFDAIVLAAAGLRRLGLTEYIAQVLDTSICLPAVGQGAIGIECRCDDTATLEVLQALHHVETAGAVMAERGLTAALGADCGSPVAGFAQWERHELHLCGMVASVDGGRVIRHDLSGSGDPTTLGRELAGALRELGADDLLSETA